MHLDRRRRRASEAGRTAGRALLPALLACCLLAGACSVVVAGSPQRRDTTTPGASSSISPGGDGGSGTAPATAVGDGDGASGPSAGSPEAPADAGAVEPYVVKGRVTTVAGKPVAGAEVWADNTLAYNSNALAVSGSDGSYRIELPRSEALTWRMGGHIDTSYDGQKFELDLAVDSTPFASADGAIRDFTWRLDGAHDDDPDMFYGGLVYVYEDVNHQELGDGDWQITFTPDGPLIDGSTGQSFARDVHEGQISGVPIGRYTVTATYLPADGSGPVALLIRPRDTGDYAPSATATFRPDSIPLMQLEIVKP